MSGEREIIEVKSATREEVIAVSKEMKEVVELVTVKVAESMRLCESLAKDYALK